MPLCVLKPTLAVRVYDFEWKFSRCCMVQHTASQSTKEKREVRLCRFTVCWQCCLFYQVECVLFSSGEFRWYGW